MRSTKVKWLLLADIHFKHQDLSRITQTAAWVRSVAARHQVHRVIVCGDLLTSRSSQPTHVLSACYRFLGSLVHDAQVTHVHVLLGNHDLAYRRDYSTTALDALHLAAPAVQLHREVGSYVWDGRRVLMLPFREDQSELTGVISALERDDAAQTVAFAHLAIHRAITQRHVVHPNSSATPLRTGSVAYHGLIGPGCFSSLSRTFTGHFHCHQTIVQQPNSSTRSGSPEEAEASRLRGSVTYVGSPLQLTWADLWDEQRGVILLDPETLDHELIVNPYAVGYTTADVDEVLSDAADPTVVHDRHVMLLGNLTPFKYATARDKLVSLGARSIRNWSPMAPTFQGTVVSRGLGASTPASDSLLQKHKFQPDNEMREVETGGQNSASSVTGLVLPDCPPRPVQVDIREQAAKYVDALELDKALENSRELLIQVGQRLLEAAASDHAEKEKQAPGEGQPEILDYKCVMPPHKRSEDGPFPARVGATTSSELVPSTVFDAQPRSLTITNFLGIQSTIHLNFGTDIRRGLTFLVGENGSGKSTLVEAMVWCQFGKCLRSGLGVNDVVNDKAKRNCSVRVQFDNGYAIQRYRKHKEYGNRIIVERDGKVLPEFEKADTRGTQAAINELLGVDYDTFVRTIVLSRENTSSFLSSTPSERRALILSILGLDILDRCANITHRFLRELGDEKGQFQSKLDGLQERIDYLEERLMGLTTTKEQLQDELQQIAQQKDEALADLRMTTDLDTKATADQPARFKEQMSAAKQEVDALLHRNRLANIRKAFEEARSAIQDRRLTVSHHLRKLETKHTQLLSTKPVADAETTSMFSWLLDILARMYHRLHSIVSGLDSSYPYASTATEKKQAGGSLVRAFLCRFLTVLGKLTGVEARREANARELKEQHAYHLNVEEIEKRITQHRQQLSLLGDLGSETQIAQQIAVEREIPVQDVCDSLQEITAESAEAIPAQLNEALKTLADLQQQRELRASKHAKLRDLQGTARVKSERIATYTQIIEEDSAAQKRLEAGCDVLRSKLATLAADRAPFDFWASALAQKSRRVSSQSSATSSYTFREFVLEQSLAELNTVTAQILTILFEQSRHATALTSGMLRSLFVGEDSTARENHDTSSAALDSSLSVGASLSYGKRSGGERKRIDLALFFALMYVGHARSPHRAHYMLVDEVFDSLDAAGQAAVVRWCNALASGRVSYIVVTTHSEALVPNGVLDGEGDQEGGFRGAVLATRMGKDSVELEMDGRRIG